MQDWISLVLFIFTLITTDSSILGTSIQVSPTPTPTLHIVPTYSYVTRVVDGDTIVVTEGDKTYTVRIIGIDAPESVKPRHQIDCFGLESSAHAHQLLEHTQITLLPDPTQQDKDRYGRLLRYVMVDQSKDIGEMMIRDGYAREYTYKTPYQKKDIYLSAQRDAEEHHRGMWGASCPLPSP